MIYYEAENDLDITTLATAPRVGTSLRTAVTSDLTLIQSGGRPRTMTGRPVTGMVKKNCNSSSFFLN